MIFYGGTPRKVETDRWRSTTDAGDPRKRLADGSGVPGPSIYHFSRHFPRQLDQKPTPRDLANDLALLSHAAHLANDDVFIVTDGVADYFPHLSLGRADRVLVPATPLLPGDKGFSNKNVELPLSRSMSLHLGSFAL
eukprot:200484-Pleurochrysis_carterae.AAC.4